MRGVVTKETLTSSPSLSAETPAKHVIHWFRKGLRLHDNPSFKEGLQKANTYRCVFIIDPWFAGASNVGINKWRTAVGEVLVLNFSTLSKTFRLRSAPDIRILVRGLKPLHSNDMRNLYFQIAHIVGMKRFLLQCLEDLDLSLKKLNSRLFVVRGQPAEALPKLFKEWSTTTLSFEEDPEPFGRVRDHNIAAMCRDAGVTVVSRVSHTLYELDKIIELNGGRAPLTYHQFQALVAGMPRPTPAQSAVDIDTLEGATTPLSKDHDARFGVPSLEELGFETDSLAPAAWMGGECEALVRLERHLQRKAWVASYGRPTMTPQLLLASQTGLSPYLRFGCLSPRLFYGRLTDLYYEVKQQQPPLSLHGQLLWREFFYCAATRNPNFDRMLGNPICVQIPWDRNAEALAKWANGQTGYPWIDAIMIQLREEGWVHHLARHAVACFLTRGDLFISWEEGMKVFEELLLDADWSVNAGTWMWLSCSSFFQQFFHCYCPVDFGRKLDPNGDFIRKYIPILKDMPIAYLHSPWRAPASVQSVAQCVVGRDYPLPLVDHLQASNLNIQRIRRVYNKLAKYRPQVINEGKESSLLGLLVAQNGNYTTMTLSPPIPTTAIIKINQSNYQCNIKPDLLQPSVKPPIDSVENTNKIVENSEQNSTKEPSMREKQIILHSYSAFDKETSPIKSCGSEKIVPQTELNINKERSVGTVIEINEKNYKELNKAPDKATTRNHALQEYSPTDAYQNILKHDNNSNDSYQMSHLIINTEQYTKPKIEITKLLKPVHEAHRQYVKISSTDNMVQSYQLKCETGPLTDDENCSKKPHYIRSTNTFAMTDMNVKKKYSDKYIMKDSTDTNVEDYDAVKLSASNNEETIKCNTPETLEMTDDFKNDQ